MFMYSFFRLVAVYALFIGLGSGGAMVFFRCTDRGYYGSCPTQTAYSFFTSVALACAAYIVIFMVLAGFASPPKP